MTLAIICFLSSINLFASDIVVRSSRLKDTSYKSYPSKVGLVTSESTLESQVSELLEGQLNLNIASSGGLGASKSLFLRNLDSSHTLIIIDGVVANDPSNSARQFDFSSLRSMAIESIEVLAGSQSVLYGSNAIAGVILIKTKDSLKESVHLKTTLGSHQTFTQELQWSKKLNKVQVYVGSEYLSSQSISSASVDGNPNADKDEIRLGNLQFNLQALNTLFNPQYKIRYERSKVDLDNNGGAQGDDKNDFQRKQVTLQSLKFSKDFWDGYLQSSLVFSHNNTRRKSYFRADESESDSYEYHYGNIYSSQVLNSLDFSPGNKLQFGFGAQNETHKKRQTSTSESMHKVFESHLYFQHLTKWKNLFLNYGARSTLHQQFNNRETIMLSPGIYLDHLKIKSFLKYSTGFKSPSLFQFFDSSFGNPKLLPEESKNYEWGLEFSDLISINVFLTRVKNKISFDSSFRSINEGEVESRGYEFSFSPKIGKFDLDIMYIYAHAYNRGNRLYLLRRPKNKLTSRISYSHKKSHVYLTHIYVGSRDDIDAQTNLRTSMPSYNYFNLKSIYQYTQSLQFFCELKNIFNTAYEEVNGFSSTPREVYFGIKKVL